MKKIDYEIVSSKEGKPTIVVNRDGKKIPLHSRIAPSREVSSLKNQFDEKYEMVIILGAGLGYHLEPLKQKEFKKIIVVDIISSIEIEIEKNEIVNFLFDKKNLKFVTGKDLNYLKKYLTNEIDFDEISGIKVVDHPASFRIFNDYYSSIAKIIKEIIDNKAGNIVTKNSLGKRFFLNIAKNFQVMENFFGVSTLFNKFKGETAIVITSGPSVENVLPLIKKNRDSFFIIAVDSAISLLNGFKIKADFVISIDPQSHIMEHLLPFELNGAIPIFSISSYPALLRNYSGFISLNSHPLSQFFTQIYPNEIGSIDSKTGTVAGDAILFAIRCGFSNIGIAGYDFSFIDKKIYARGTAYQKRFGEFFANRIKNVIDYNISYIRKASKNVKFQGRDSRKSFLTYKNSIENLLKVENVNIYNIKRLGLEIDKVKDIEFEEFLLLSKSSVNRYDEISKIIKPLQYLRGKINFNKIYEYLLNDDIFDKVMKASLEKYDDGFEKKINILLNCGVKK